MSIYHPKCIVNNLGTIYFRNKYFGCHSTSRIYEAATRTAGVSARPGEPAPARVSSPPRLVVSASAHLHGHLRVDGI
ncbi:MAG: hypothetical protein J0H91_03475 [Rhodospirillales bacterium]|nr:hypothetical protein [Rhodospirillales bacterium]